MMRQSGTASALLLGLLALGGCADTEMADLAQWMDDVKNKTKAKVAEVAPPKKFLASSYSNHDEIAPFDLVKLTGSLDQQQTQKNQNVAPDLARPREPLESYPLDALRMVGSIQKKEISYAVLSTDGLVHTVRAGQYIGQNLGKVIRVGSAEILIKEYVQDAAGDWVEREAKLELQEAGK